MGNLFTRQIRKRAQADEEMRRKADGLINEAITRKKTRDIFSSRCLCCLSACSRFFLFLREENLSRESL